MSELHKDIKKIDRVIVSIKKDLKRNERETMCVKIKISESTDENQRLAWVQEFRRLMKCGEEILAKIRCMEKAKDNLKKEEKATTENPIKSYINMSNSEEPFLCQQIFSLNLVDSEPENGYSCIICMDRQRNVVLMPCRHFKFCQECSGSVQECPECRCTIQERLKVYV